jgi:hypothetical protein
MHQDNGPPSDVQQIAVLKGPTPFGVCVPFGMQDSHAKSAGLPQSATRNTRNNNLRFK